MVEACPVCDTLWRLYAKAVENLHELVGKRTEAHDRGDQNTLEILTCEISIAQSALPVVRRELRRHEASRHAARQENHKQSQNEQGQKR